MREYRIQIFGMDISGTDHKNPSVMTSLARFYTHMGYFDCVR
jgi:hypothetical protein